MKKLIKTLALTTAAIGLATVIKRKKEQPAGTGHSKVFYGESKPKKICKGDAWFTNKGLKLQEDKITLKSPVSFQNKEISDLVRKFWKENKTETYVAAFLDKYLEIETGDKKIKAKLTDLNGKILQEFYLTKR